MGGERRERPILMSAPMVRATLAGTKTQTRRLVTNRHVGFIGGKGEEADPGAWGYYGEGGDFAGWMVLARGVNQSVSNNQDRASIPCPYGEPGDRLWLKETWRVVSAAEGDIGYRATESSQRFYSEGDRAWWRSWEKKSWGKRGATWCPCIYMPRWASRLTLDITSVRVERLGDISEADARAEGVRPCDRCDGRGIDPVRVGDDPDWCAECGGGSQGITARDEFERLWSSIHGDGAWERDRDRWVWVIGFRRVEG